MAPKPNSITEELEKKCCSRNIPFAVLFELTYFCNLACKHCYVAAERRQEISTEKIKDTLNQLKAMGTFYVGFTGGEIFARNDCLDILHYARDKGFYLILLTNGTLITSEIAAILQKIKPIGMEISLLGATPETHDGITCVDGSFAKAVQAIKLLVSRGIFVITKTTLLKENVHEYKQIKSLASSLGAVPRFSTGIVPRSDGETFPQNYQITWNDRRRFLDGEIVEESFLTFFERTGEKYLTCKAGKALAAINPYGDVSPCVLVPVKLGSLNKKTFKEIWHATDNAFLNELRQLNTADLTQCVSCELSSVCIRCTGAAYRENNSLAAPYAAACEEARWKSFQLSHGGTKKL